MLVRYLSDVFINLSITVKFESVNISSNKLNMDLNNTIFNLIKYILHICVVFVYLIVFLYLMHILLNYVTVTRGIRQGN